RGAGPMRAPLALGSSDWVATRVSIGVATVPRRAGSSRGVAVARSPARVALDRADQRARILRVDSADPGVGYLLDGVSPPCSAEESGASILRGARDPALPCADRSRDGVLRRGAARVRAVLGENIDHVKAKSPRKMGSANGPRRC